MNLCRHQIEDTDSSEDARVAIALYDDHDAMREVLARALGRFSDFSVVATGRTGTDAETFVNECVADVLILDLNMPGGGADAVRRIARVAPSSRIIVLTSEDDAHNIDNILAAGAGAFVVKGSSIRAISEAIRRVMAGRIELSPSLAASLIGERPLAVPWGRTDDRPVELLEREEQILLRLSQGFTAEEIGINIGMGTEAVTAFITNVMLKLHAYSSVAR